MREISFAWTTAAVIAGRKTVTRRDWKTSYAVGFRKGERLTALNKDRRGGGRPFGTIELTAAPRWQLTSRLTPNDWEDEGFAFLEEAFPAATLMNGRSPVEVWNDWLNYPRGMWVVRFRLVGLVDSAPLAQPRFDDLIPPPGTPLLPNGALG